ncbi:MAG: hypothetical protein A3H28_08405 [Acidobacteria bacterium RIFCSPLOWO2_02_FULL_61_28]|nr:MAG: hypothetical protein A3H28_08405 [Acidobacteria bacterium RIFCSPLOWO2_02_FULL_61_28]
MNDIAEKFASLEAVVSKERGDFSLFALFLREDAPDRWDLLVAAPWASQKRDETVEYLVNEIKSHLGPQELINLSRILVVEPHDPKVQEFTKAFPVEHGRLEVWDSIIFGLPIRHGFIITAKSPEVPVAK